MRLGFLFAGQGSQHPGMGADLYETYPAFRAIFDEAPLDFDLKETCFTDPHNMLDQTRYTQPAMVAFAAGVLAVLAEKRISPQVVAGLSLGEYSALHAAGVFDAPTAISTVAFRGACMERAAQGIDCKMAAMLGISEEDLRAACDKASSEGCVCIANYNCPGQLVIGGETIAVDAAIERAREKGARRAIPLNVSGPFHTPLMAPAGEELAAYFLTVDFHEASIPVIFNCLGNVKQESDEIASLLVRQVQSSVRMEESIRRMGELGVDAIIEIGPGKALSGFVRKTLPNMPVCAVETVEDIEGLPQWLDALSVDNKEETA